MSATDEISRIRIRKSVVRIRRYQNVTVPHHCGELVSSPTPLNKEFLNLIESRVTDLPSLYTDPDPAFQKVKDPDQDPGLASDPEVRVPHFATIN